MLRSLPFFSALWLGAALTAAPAWAESLTNWPCKGCFTGVPASAGDGRAPRPLLVALHGDGGGASKLFQAWQAACDAAGVVLLVPRCPVDLGCPLGSSYWQWYFSGKHDPAWLGRQIDAVAGRYPIDPARTYATGYSGGATYLGYYGPENPRKFAAIAHVAGGMPFGLPCPSCKLPVLFVIGAADPMIVPYTRPLRQYYDACGGHEVVWEALRGVSHEGILDVLRAGRAKTILEWLLARPAACLLGEPLDGGVDASEDSGAGAGTPAQGDAGALGVGARGDEPAEARSAEPAPPMRAHGAERPPPGCACGVGRGDGPGAWLASLALLGAFFRRARRRWTTRLPERPDPVEKGSPTLPEQPDPVEKGSSTLSK